MEQKYKKAPLCKGSSRIAGEGLLRSPVDLQMIQNNRINNPSDTIATLGCATSLWSHAVDPHKGAFLPITKTSVFSVAAADSCIPAHVPEHPRELHPRRFFESYPRECAVRIPAQIQIYRILRGQILL